MNEETVRHLADLSNISLQDDAVKNLTEDLRKIIDYIDELSELDTTNVEPTYQVTGLSNVWREDEVKPQLSREDLLKISPDSAKNSIKVAKVL